MNRATLCKTLALLLVVAAIGSMAFVGTASARQDVAITTVNVTPSEPAPGERVTLETTISNLDSSDESIEITDIYVREVGGVERARVEDIGSVAVGGSLTVPLSTSFDREGEYDLRVHVVAQDSQGTQRITYPVYLTVSQSDDVQIAIQANDFVADEESSVNVSVANGGDVPISNVRLTLESDGARVNSPKRVSGSIPATSDREYAFDVQFPEAGTGGLTASLTYTVSGDVTRTATDSTEVTVDPASATTEGRIHLTGIETSLVGDRFTIQGEAANVGTSDAQSVLLSVQPSDGVTPVQPAKEYFVGTVEGSEFGTFELTAQVESSVSAVPVQIEWTVDDDRRSTVVELPVEASGGVGSGGSGSNDGDGPDGPPSGGGPLAFIGGLGGLAVVVVVLLVLGGGYYAWNRR